MKTWEKLFENLYSDFISEKIPIVFGHYGGKSLSTIKKLEIPCELKANFDTWDSNWTDSKNQTIKMEMCLKKMMEDFHSFEGVTIIDTMRNGSDVYRPGALLSKSASWFAENKYMVKFIKNDDICPDPQILKRYMNDESYSFVEYASDYREYMSHNKRFQYCLFLILESLKQNLIPLFFCSDPYIPGYLDKNKVGTVEYLEHREIQDVLRLEGCHRVVITNELIIKLKEDKLHCDLIEVIPTIQNYKLSRF